MIALILLKKNEETLFWAKPHPVLDCGIKPDKPKSLVMSQPENSPQRLVIRWSAPKNNGAGSSVTKKRY